MLKKYPVIKWSLIVITCLVALVVSLGFWFMSLLPSGTHQTKLDQIQPDEIPYLAHAAPVKRGKVLAVVSSCEWMGDSQKRAGYELSELARPYYVFQANGFEVDVASPKGGTPPVVYDWEDMGAYDYAFLNDAIAKQKINHTIPLDQVVPSDYEAVYFVGGKGAMFDFPENSTIQSIVREYFEAGKVIGAVCHGPAALVNVTLQDGTPLLANKKVSGFTNEEELFLIPDAATVFPFLLEDAMVAKGARMNKGSLYLEMISQDGNLITGQNPWSTWAFAEAMVQQMGYTPKRRKATAEENAIEVLVLYERKGYQPAVAGIQSFVGEENELIDRRLFALHSMLAVMRGQFGKAIDLVRMLKRTNDLIPLEG